MKSFIYILILLIGINFTSFAQYKNPAQGEPIAKLIKPYPIPATTAINFEFQYGYDKYFTLQIYNFMGKKINDFKKSYAYLNKTIRVSPNYYKGYYNRGLLQGKTQHYKEAIADFTKAIALKPYYKAYVGRGNTYLLLKEYDKALADGEMALQENATNVRAHFLIANCYDDLNQLDKALTYYNKTITSPFVEPVYYMRRGILLGKQQQFQSCLNDLNTCTALNPQFAEAYYWKGVAKVNLKQNPCTDLRTAVSLGFMAAQQSIAMYCK